MDMCNVDDDLISMSSDASSTEDQDKDASTLDTPEDDVEVDTLFSDIEGLLAPGVSDRGWPPPLFEYVRRCFRECGTNVDKDMVKVILKGKITEAATSNVLWSKNWEEEPLPANLVRKVQPTNEDVTDYGKSKKLEEELHVGDVFPPQPPSKKQKLIYMKTSETSTSHSISVAQRTNGCYINNNNLTSKTPDPYNFSDVQSPSTSSNLSSTPPKRKYFQLIREKSLDKPTEGSDVSTKEEIWSKFINIFYLSKYGFKPIKKGIVYRDQFLKDKGFPNPLKDVLSSNPYNATNEDVYDFIFYIDLSEKLNNSYFQAIISTINFYRQSNNHLDEIEVYQNIKKASPRFQGPWILDSSKVKSLPILLDIPEQSKELFKTFKDFCDDSSNAADPFNASPKTVYGFIKSVFERMTYDYSSLLKPHIDFYQENVKTILTSFSHFMEYPLTHDDWMENSWIQKIVEAAKACDEKLHGNRSAISLLPSYNYTRARINGKNSEEGYWTSSFLKKALHDLRKDALSLHAAAKDLGVTPEMLHNAKCEIYTTVLDEKNNKLLSLSEFVGNGFGSKSQYWKDSKMQGLLAEVRHRRIPIEVLAFKIGVSRSKVDLKCGGVKSLKEIEAEEELERIQRIRQQEEAAENRIKTTHLDRQIMDAEDNEEDLCEYERQRLANLRERKALMEMLDMAGDKNEIKKLNRIIQRPGSKEGIEAGVEDEKKTPTREKSARILKQQERRRLKSSEEALTKSLNLSKFNGLTPHWFGRHFPNGQESRAKDVLIEMNRCNVLPKFEISAREILEITDDYRKSKTLYESISEEWKDMVDGEDKYKTEVNWKFFTEVKEHLVSSSPVTCIDSYGDFVTYGTENGAVGLLIAGHSLNLRPHTDMVSGLVMDRSSVLSSSFDGTVRRLDLHRGRVPIEYNWDWYGDCKHGVLGMARGAENTHILDCDKKLIILDLRKKDTASLMDIEGVGRPYPYSDLRPTTIKVEPINSNLFSVCRDSSVSVWDVRNMEKTVWKLNSHSLSFAGWNSDGTEFSVCRNDKYWIFDVQGGTPAKDRRCHFDVPNSIRTSGRENFSLDGSLWCPWQSSLLFYVGKSKKRLSSKHSSTTTCLSAFDTANSGKFDGGDVDVDGDLDVDVQDTLGHFVVHCHQTRPLLVLGNTDGVGRIKLISSAV